jgi:NAD(P)-dependent dehydrogenase (short-subunit alcohol dehydrogenase family)
MLTIGGYEGSQDSNFKRKIISQIPKNRLAIRDDLPGALTFLLSDASKYMNGQNLILDGGFTII